MGTLLAVQVVSGIWHCVNNSLNKEENRMAVNWDVIKGKWSQFKGDARTQWGKITDDDWDQIAGRREKLAGVLQERYGWEREEAERRVDDFFETRSS
jgi:uncharacterized protein YjbJ (UPF0337 family)